MRRPWAVITTSVLAALVAGGALAGANAVREHRAAAPPSTSPPPASETVGVSGCLVEPCQVLTITRVAGTQVELVADRGARSGRLRLGGPTSSDVIEATVTDLGVTLTKSSLQCVAGPLSACVIRGEYGGGTAGQVVVGRSGKWSSLDKPFLSDAGYLALAEVTGAQSGPEVVVARYDCDRAAVADCAGTPVYAQVVGTNGRPAGCTAAYDELAHLPGYPDVALTSEDLSPC